MIGIDKLTDGSYLAVSPSGQVVFSAKRASNGGGGNNGRRGYASTTWAHDEFSSEKDALSLVTGLLGEFDGYVAEAGIGPKTPEPCMLRIYGSRFVSLNLGLREQSVGELGRRLDQLIIQYLENGNPVMFSRIEIIAPYGVIELLARDPHNSRDASLGWSPNHGFFMVSSNVNVSAPLTELVRKTISGVGDFEPGSLAGTLRELYR